MPRTAYGSEKHRPYCLEAENVRGIYTLDQSTLAILKNEKVVWRFRLAANGKKTQVVFGDAALYTHHNLKSAAELGVEPHDNQPLIQEYGRWWYRQGTLNYHVGRWSAREETDRFLTANFPDLRVRGDGH